MPGNSPTAFYIIFIIGVVVVAALGGLVYLTTPTDARWFQNVMGRLRRVRDSCVDELGRYVGALAVLLAGAAATIIVCWPFGRFARRYKPNIDAPFLRWTKNHVTVTGGWHHLVAVTTRLSNIPDIQVAVVVGAIVLAMLWARRGFWIPLIVVPLAYVFEKYGQMTLTKVVDRQPTPTLPADFGTFPSGGCARTIVVYGVIWYLLTLRFPQVGRRGRVAGFTVVALLGFVEGYTRVFLIKHWGLDVVGGWLFGALLLLSVIAAASCFRDRSAAAAATASTDLA